MDPALVLSAGGMFAAWELGAWKTLSRTMQPPLIVGASAGALLGWSIAGGVPLEETERDWLDPATAEILRFGLHRSGLMRPDALYRKAQRLFDRSRPMIPFALTMVEVPNLRLHVVRDQEIGWKHLAATCSIPFFFPPVEIDGRRYVDGGFRGALPLWAAEKLGATRALALNALTGWPWSLLRKVTRPPRAGAGLNAVVLEPSTPLGSLRHGVVWSQANIRRWIRQGEQDANGVYFD
jgi:predicted acylesterase/phospholipase RssA